MFDNFRSRSKYDFEFDALTENVLMLVRGEKLYFVLQTYIKSQEEILTMNWTVFLSSLSDKIRTSWIDVQSSEIFALLFTFSQKSCMSICQTQISQKSCMSICQTQIKILLGCERLTPTQSLFKKLVPRGYCFKVSLKLYFWCINSYCSLIS